MILILLLKTQKQQITGTVSDEIVFNTRILQDFFESVGNRVLSIDDMSGTFNSNPRSTPFSIASQFPLNTQEMYEVHHLCKRQKICCTKTNNGC